MNSCLLPGRQRPRVVDRVGAAAVATAMLAAVVGAVATPRVLPAYAQATDGGPAQVITPNLGTGGTGLPLTNGGSATEFSLRLPAGAACTGDSANDQPPYLVQSYMVPASVEPSTLTFDANGPVPAGVGSSFRQPLHDAAASPFVNQFTAPASPAPGPGAVINTDGTPLSFAVFAEGDIAAGTYNVGIACTHNSPAAPKLDKFWNAQMVIVADAADEPAGITWTVAGQAATTTTSGATTTTAVGNTTTTSAATPTSRATATTVSGASTSTTPASTTSTSGTGAAKPLARTGGSSLPLLVWAVLLVILGRMVVLVVRTPGARRNPTK